MFGKVNISRIVSDHWATLHASHTDKISWWDVLLFGGMPLIPVIIFWDTTANDKNGAFWDIALTSLSIFAGLLLNLLVLLYGLIEKPITNEQSDDPVVAKENAKTRNLLLREVYYNVSYAVLVAVLSILALVFLMVVGKESIERLLSSALYFLLAHFVLTMFMILKRIHALLSYEFARREQSH